MSEQVPVPSAADGEDVIVTFAHTYDGYRLHGGMGSLVAIVEPVRERWQRTGELGDDVDALRACLFLEARAHRHGGYGRFSRQPFPAALVTRIRELSGGSVPLRSTIT